MQLIAQASDAGLSGLVLDAGAQRRPDICRVIDAGRDLAQHPAGPQLVDDRRRNAQPRGDALDTGRRGAGRTQALEQPADPLLHLRIEPGRCLGEANAPPIPGEAAIGDQVVDDAPEVRILKRQWLRAAVTRRWSAAGGGPNARDQRVDAQVRGQRLLSVESAQGRHDEALGKPALRGIDSPDGHAGRVPSVAIRMASDSSSER